MQQQKPRSRVIVGLLSLAVFVGAALTSSPAQAETGVGPYYAPPAWARTLPSAARFMTLSNFAGAAVLDRETGLVWEKSPTGALQWGPSRLACINKTVGGRKGWRLPSITELASLIDPNQSNPALPSGHPFLIPPVEHNHGSATTDAVDSTRAWAVDIDGSHVLSSGKDETTHIWCVRGPMNADQY
jgi:hypothetical protein